MPKLQYQEFNFGRDRLKLIEQCNEIIVEYQADGLRLTLRQLYYQLVARDIIPNKVTEYKRLGDVVNNGRLAGLIDWDAIEDRTRNLETVNHWQTPEEIIEAVARQFRNDKWADQPVRPEVWIEKEALAGVFDRICTSLDVPYFACRGYCSQSEMWAAAMRFVKYIKAGQTVRVFHFGDHDPSGIDMTRDIQDRLRMFVAAHVGPVKARAHLFIRRIALNMDQVEQYSPPENPAKTTDSRFAVYEAEFGDSSWELDALNPRILSALVRENIAKVRDENAWRDALEAESRHRAELQTVSNNWTEISEHVGDEYEDQLENFFDTDLKDSLRALEDDSPEEE